MATLHDVIDNYLAADLHGELLEDERNALHTHLVECAACRKAHQETKIMNKILEENLASEKPDGAFEQRMLAGFRNRIPQQRRFMKSFANLMRLGPIQITALVAVLLALVQIGRMITEETQPPRRFAGLPLAKDERGRVVVGERRDMAATSSFATGRANVKPAAPALAQARDGLSAQPQVKSRAEPNALAETERTVVTGSEIPTPEETAP